MTDAAARLQASESARVAGSGIGGGHSGIGPGGGPPPPGVSESEAKQAGAAPAAAPSGPPQYAISLYEFETQEADDLPFQADQKILLLHCDEAEDWWQGQLNGRRGMFPRSYVRKLDPEEKVGEGGEGAGEGGAAGAGDGQQIEGGEGGAEGGEGGEGAPKAMNARCVALFDFAGEDADDLGFKARDRLVITGELDGWFLGRLENGDRTGIFPSNYVRILDDSEP